MDVSSIALGAFALGFLILASWVIWDKTKLRRQGRIRQLEAALQQAQGHLAAREGLIVNLALAHSKDRKPFRIPKATVNLGALWAVNAKPRKDGGVDVTFIKKDS